MSDSILIWWFLRVARWTEIIDRLNTQCNPTVTLCSEGIRRIAGEAVAYLSTCEPQGSGTMDTEEVEAVRPEDYLAS